MAYAKNSSDRSGLHVDKEKPRRKGQTCEVNLRPAVESDLAAVNDIYNHYVLHSTCTYQEQPETLRGRYEWFHAHGPRYPVMVAEHENKVVGWSALSPYHRRSAYRHTVENSVYVHQDWHRRGIGFLLLEDLIARARALGHHAIIAAIDAEHADGIRLHTAFGFVKAGHLKHVGFKFDRWLDVIYLELLL
jgi:L-amino acid N-acyltransferase